MRSWIFGAAMAALTASPAPATAQTSGGTGGGPAPNPRSATLPGEEEEVIVTSRRKEERVQDVPAAVTGVSADQIQALGGIRDVKDIANLLPGFAFVDTGNINQDNNIRGAGA